VSPKRDLTGDQARQLIDEILARTADDFIMHLSWKERGTPRLAPDGARSGQAQVRIEQHLSFHGTWTSQEIMATGKGRNRQIQEIILRSMKKG